MIFDEFISFLGSAAVILVVGGGVLVLLVVSRQRRANPKWGRIATITQGVVAVLGLGVAAVLLAVSSDDPRLRF